MESPPPAPPEVLPLLLECLSLAGQFNPGAGQLNQGPVKLMDELSGLAFWPLFRVARDGSWNARLSLLSRQWALWTCSFTY